MYVYRPAGYYFCTSQRWGASARAHAHIPFPYLANGWADWVQILCVAMDPLDKSFTQVRWDIFARLHLHTPFPYLANGLEDCVEIWCVARDPFDESYRSATKAQIFRFFAFFAFSSLKDYHMHCDGIGKQLKTKQNNKQTKKRSEKKRHRVVRPLHK